VPRFKRRVRQLKELGLTESLEVGYRLSPRGDAALQWLVASPAAGPSWRGRAQRRRPREMDRTVASPPECDFPEWVEPMAATLTQERFTSPEWSFERKLDGIRLLAFRRGAGVRLLSRNRLPQDCPRVAEQVAALPLREVILDGELTWSGTAYHVFDVLWLDGRDLRPLPLDERRAVLAPLPLQPPLVRVTPLDGPSRDESPPWERACREGWEGVIAKRRDSPYESRRSPHWLKMKCEASQELVVGGFTEPKGKRVGLGALLVGYFDGDDFVFAGKVGTGFDGNLLGALRERLDALEVPARPFTRGKGFPRLHAHWVRPEVVVQVAFIEWTVHDKLRHARLLGLREDKAAREVTRKATGKLARET
jgi:ATP-dependent DNA ligase